MQMCIPHILVTQSCAWNSKLHRLTWSVLLVFSCLLTDMVLALVIARTVWVWDSRHRRVFGIPWSSVWACCVHCCVEIFPFFLLEGSTSPWNVEHKMLLVSCSCAVVCTGWRKGTDCVRVVYVLCTASGHSVRYWHPGGL